EVLDRPDGATQVSLHLTDPHQAAQALLTARQVLSESGLEILPWQEVLPQLDNFVKVDRKMGGILLGVIGFIVALGVFNTILVSVLERTREFGVLMAVGLRPRKLAALIMTEGLLLGIGGMILGIGLGALAAWPLIELGLDLSESMGGETIETAGVVSSTHIFGAWYWPRVIQYSIIGVVFSLCAAFLPARQVARLQPVDAMRHH
ncbi:MAG: FtsX-like permease family protein, partial [Myxococcota bacterium]|nr:FtsX-like permease family protein [Myxococcota bacterium]